MTNTTITPGQIFFRQRKNSSVEFVKVHDIIGDQIYFQDMEVMEIKGSRTSMSREVKPVQSKSKSSTIYGITLSHNEFIGYYFGGNLYTFEAQGVPYIPHYELFTDESITLHDND
jgi:hypothetical protein